MAILRAELLKWKRSRVLPAVLLATAVSPAVYAALFWGVERIHPDKHFPLSWFHFQAQVAWFAHMLVYPLTFAFVGTYVIAREFQEGTASNLYALPVSRAAITLAKVGSTALILLVAIAAAVPLAVLIGLPVLEEPPTLNGILWALGLHLETGLAQFLLLPVTLWLAAWTRDYIAPLAAGGFFVVSNVASRLGGENWLWIPTAVPAWTALAPLFQDIAPHVPKWWLVLMPIFVVFLALTVVWTARTDVP